MKAAIVARARELGFDLCRITDARAPETADRFREWLRQGRHGAMGYLERTMEKRVRPEAVLERARSVVVVAASYHFESVTEAEGGVGSAPAGSRPQGVVARYARHADYHEVIGERLAALAAYVSELSAGASRSLWYVDTGPLLERDLAQRAGVGFIGKHTNLISRSLGNWFLLGEVLTTAALEPDPPEGNRCGTCSRCLAACPTQAITAPFQLDARRCISYLTIELKGAIPESLRDAIGHRVFGCDDCLEVCPWNRFAREGRLLRAHARPELGRLEVEALLELDEVGFKRRFAGTPLLRSKRRGLLRNACVVLGNIGDARSLSALERARADREELVAEHASWAIAKITARERTP